MTDIELCYGKEKLRATLPASVGLQVVNPNEKPGIPDEKGELAGAIRTPLGSRPLSHIANGKKNAVILVSDATRPSPSHLLLPPIVDELGLAGIEQDDITVIVALGVHRQSTPGEKKRIMGSLHGRIECVDHDPGDCVPVGTTKLGTDVEVSARVVEADVIVATGAVEYHYFAGYTGGAKSILPGVCSPSTIERNHQMMTHPHSRAGYLDGPVRADMEEAAGLVGLDFILNVVLNESKEMIGVFAGDYVEAHREASKIVDEMYGIPANPADIVITCAIKPKDINMYQAMKALDNTVEIIKPGGTVVLVASCPEGVGDDVFESWMSEASTPDDILNRVEQKFELGGNAAVSVARLLQRAEIIAVTDMRQEALEPLMMEKAIGLQQAIDAALERHGNDADVLVMPSGASTFPRPARLNI